MIDGSSTASESHDKYEIIRRAEVNVDLEVIVRGESEESVILVPSAWRGATDFSDLVSALAPLKIRTVSFNPRGAGRSTRPSGRLTLHDIADDIAAIAGGICTPPVHLVGHALGNTFVRCAAADYPDLVSTVTLLACGPNERYVPGDLPRATNGLQEMADIHLSETERLQALGVFFASGNDPRPWLDGWWPDSSPLVDAFFRTPPEDWWTAGTDVPVLLIQGEEDRAAPPTAGRNLAQELGPRRSRLVELPHCGHAMLPEQGEMISRLLTDYLMDNRTH